MFIKAFSSFIQRQIHRFENWSPSFSLSPTIIATGFFLGGVGGGVLLSKVSFYSKDIKKERGELTTSVANTESLVFCFFVKPFAMKKISQNLLNRYTQHSLMVRNFRYNLCTCIFTHAGTAKDIFAVVADKDETAQRKSISCKSQ